MSGFIGSITNGVGSLTGALGATGGPPSQKNRPISFALEVDGTVVQEVTLTLRPQDFSRTDPSRVTVHHTLGGAWADNFGPGLPSINISGHTGWRGGSDGNGETRWQAFRDLVYNAWHNRRKDAVQQGRDPALVKLLYADSLSGFVVEVAPLALTLRRSKSQPLLIQYQLSLIVLDQNRNQLQFLQGGSARQTPGEEGGFFASVLGSLARIRAAIGQVQRWVSQNIIAPVRSFLTLANTVIASVLGVLRDVRGVVTSVLAVPMMVAQAGANLFRMFAAVVSLPLQIKHDIMGVAAAFTNVTCFLLRSRSARLAYGDYNPFYGASNCSSISGGRPASPLAGVNAFNSLPVAGVGASGVAISSSGREGLMTLANADPVQRPPSSAQISTALVQVQEGVTVPA